MTPEEFKAARLDLKLSQNEIAMDLGVSDSRTVRRWEAGDRDIPGSIAIVIEYWRRDLVEGRDRIVMLPAEATLPG